ncbi:MAG: MoaD/ThiS family protein [Acidimicrobiia bacterium]|nr:MoaD/ThiS family protein [Acidimicrobiia bacterium]
MAQVTLRLFAVARVAAGTGVDTFSGDRVGDVLAAARQRYGPGFAEVLAGCKVWCNGEPASDDDPLREGDEVAVLPPVSGG